MDYFQKHGLIRKIRGSASQHWCIACRERKARHWATVHGASGDDPHADYVPMCTACHGQYDRESHAKSSETRQKMSAYQSNRTLEHQMNLTAALQGRVGGMTGKCHTDEARDKIRLSQPYLGKSLPVETRRRMSEAAKRRWAARRGEVIEQDGRESHQDAEPEAS